MNKIIFITVIIFCGLILHTLAFSADELSYEIKDSRVDKQILTVSAQFKYKTYNEILDVPIYEPANKDAVMEALKNRALTVKNNVDATNNNIDLKPEVDKEKDKEVIVPTAIEIE